MYFLPHRRDVFDLFITQAKKPPPMVKRCSPAPISRGFGVSDHRQQESSRLGTGISECSEGHRLQSLQHDVDCRARLIECDENDYLFPPDEDYDDDAPPARGNSFIPGRKPFISPTPMQWHAAAPSIGAVDRTGYSLPVPSTTSPLGVRFVLSTDGAEEEEEEEEGTDAAFLSASTNSMNAPTSPRNISQVRPKCGVYRDPPTHH